eukprot:CAMPEP_0197182614 /NCGR_PEP_ID=MMETSP1423-20130617/6514_1 /TAXON_ID=476441 /ORGANISM="Pseudo-nitzschia heimii, Strain UNC1101" /LENGTH=551 /DNA_ID=CAMNT_0042633061 /DNA_START=180 /DNA_END=1836 /DNA_ORIENTATION=+
MAPLPIDNSSHGEWNADQKLLTKDSLGPLPTTPSTSEKSSSKRKNRSRKDSKSPRHVSPASSMDECDQDPVGEKDIMHSPGVEQLSPPIRKNSAPPPPPLSNGQTSPTEQPNRNVPRSKATPKSSNKKTISGRSPKSDLKHREIANDAVDAGSLASSQAGSRRSSHSHRRPRKKLHWNNSVRVKVIHNLGSYTPQEKLASWYCADDYSMMEDECELTSIHLDEIDFERENMTEEEKEARPCKRTLPAGFCERGLESWTMQGEEIKEYQVSLVIDTVWQAQIDAWEFLGGGPSKSNDENSNHTTNSAIYSDCWEFIREKCHAASMPSVICAQERAMEDEQAVDAYLNSVRSLENSRRRITKMYGGKHSSSRSITRSSRTLTTAKSQRTLTTVSSSGSTSLGGPENLKSILKTPKSRRSYCEMRPIRRSPSQSPIPLNDINAEERDSFRMRLPKYGNESNSMAAKVYAAAACEAAACAAVACVATAFEVTFLEATEAAVCEATCHVAIVCVAAVFEATVCAATFHAATACAATVSEATSHEATAAAAVCAATA